MQQVRALVYISPTYTRADHRQLALNPVDWKIQKEGIFLENYPAVVGSDASGEVVELGEGVTSFKKGDRVYASFQLD